jgi:cobalt-zinc-cadmium efflux system protein
MQCERVFVQDHRAVKPAAWAFGIAFPFFLIELSGGIYVGSLALIADAMHLLMDLIALGMTLFVAFASQRPPDEKRTFGYERLEVLAALANGILLWVAVGIILREAYQRFSFPHQVSGGPMAAIAVLGLICNLSSGWILYSSSRKNINLRGAFFHVMTDAFGSALVIVAGIVILKTGWYQADAVASVLVCFGIILSSVWLLRDSIHILLEGAPAHIHIDEVQKALSEISGVKNVHDIHLWSLTQGSESMSGHIIVNPEFDSDQALKTATAVLKERFGLSHVTLQIEK